MFVAGNSHLLVCDSMWEELLKDYEARELIMNAEDFPLEVKEYEDRKHQRGEKASNPFWTLETKEEREQFKQQEREDRDAWLKKQEGYNPYAKKFN